MTAVFNSIYLRAIYSKFIRFFPHCCSPRIFIRKLPCYLDINRICANVSTSDVLVVQSCPTFWDPMDCSLPGLSVHGIFQARRLEWVAAPFSRGSSWPRDRTWVSHVAGRFFTIWTTRTPGESLNVHMLLPFSILYLWVMPWDYFSIKEHAQKWCFPFILRQLREGVPFPCCNSVLWPNQQLSCIEMAKS